MTGADDLDERRLQIIAERVAGSRWPTVLVLLFIAAIAWSGAPRALLIAWFAAAVAAREWRALAQRRLVRATTAPVAQRLRLTVVLALLPGTLFGAAGLFMPWLDTTLGAVLTMALSGVAVGGLPINSTYARAYAAFVVPVLAPAGVMWVLAGTWIGAGLFVVILLGLGVYLVFAQANQRAFEESFRIRFENEALTRQLQAERGELERARDAAEQANREKSRFLAAASHDLRQPLQALTLNSGELVRLPLAGDAKAIAGDIGSSVEQLRSMLDALLDLSKLDAGVVIVRPQRVRMALPVQAVVAGFRAAAVARGITLESDCPHEVAVQTDPDLLRRMLSNLIDNALKFTPAGGRVGVRVVAWDDRVEMAVHDSGPGIAPEHHRLVFEDLVQLPTEDGGRAAGHGLGLGIVRRTAALLGTEVTIHSEPGYGAVFRWCLPRGAMLDRAGDAVEPMPSLTGWRVLVLDDDAMVRGACANALAGAGAELRTAATIDEALRDAADTDAAVVDWRLGEGADGFEAIERLCACRPGLPAVLVSADTGPVLAAAAQQHHIKLLRKPVDSATLALALLSAIDRSCERDDSGPAAIDAARDARPGAAVGNRQLE